MCSNGGSVVFGVVDCPVDCAVVVVGAGVDVVGIGMQTTPFDEQADEPAALPLPVALPPPAPVDATFTVSGTQLGGQSGRSAGVVNSLLKHTCLKVFLSSSMSQPIC